MSTEFDEKRKKAEELIEIYARAHASTAFVTGQLGGQFGADVVPLTALTTKMIMDICNLYEVSGKEAQTHIEHAIARLMKKNIILSRAILNWIPVMGPVANSVTTYGLIKQVAEECLKEIENKNNKYNLQR